MRVCKVGKALTIFPIESIHTRDMRHNLDFPRCVKYRDRTFTEDRFSMLIEYKGKRPNVSPTAFIAPTAVLDRRRHRRRRSQHLVGRGVARRSRRLSHRHRRPHQYAGQLRDSLRRAATDGRRRLHHRPWRDHGRLRIKRGAIIGMNVTILENIEIGEGSLIAAGSRRRAAHQDPAPCARRRRARPRSKKK